VKLIALAALGIAAFVAIWVFVVAPSERRHHERKLAAIQKQIEKRQSAEREEEYTHPDADASGRSEHQKGESG
jgi:hypothetical protein